MTAANLPQLRTVNPTYFEEARIADAVQALLFSVVPNAQVAAVTLSREAPE